MLSNNNHVSAQKLFSFDEMLNLSLCKNVTAFEKAIKPFGYNKLPAQKLPAYVQEFYSYADKPNDATGIYNTADWIVFNDKSGLHRYVNFSFVNKDHYNSIMQLIIRKGYVFVKSSSSNQNKGPAVFMQYFRKGNSGLQISLSDALIYPSTKITKSEISITTITTPIWPEGEK